MSRAALALLSTYGAYAQAQETICARVKIEIKQELTLERQAFDAEMKINNALDTASLTDVRIDIKVTDEAGVPVVITSDPNASEAAFFVGAPELLNIAAVDGTGEVLPSSTATINWLMIPVPGSAGPTPAGKKYLVSATLQYKFGVETHTLNVAPDVITVKPMPSLALDYFLTEEVIADDPLTVPIEPIEPFTLGVRVKNNGSATAKNLKIDSAQPKIIENEQGLLINFRLTGSYVDDAPVNNTLLVDFGDIPGSTAKMGRWVMETTLAGKFVEFTARFSHADELGGSLTSLLESANAHLLLRDVRVDLAGRDAVRDFLARDGDVLRVYESDGADSAVLNRTAEASLVNTGSSNFRIQMPATSGFVYVKLPDPFHGQKALGTVTRSDSKAMLAENVWLSKTKNAETHDYEYWVNVFDANTTGVYTTDFVEPPATSRAPVIQFIPDRTIREGNNLSFLIEASSPDGKPLTLSAQPLPLGSSFTQDPPNSQFPGLAVGNFSWTPNDVQTGDYLIIFTATDGTLSATRAATVTVEATPPPTPATPQVVSPAVEATVQVLKPALIVSLEPEDPASTVEFEIYSDEAMSQLVESASIPRGTTTGGANTTSFTPASNLADNSRFWWRARGYDGTVYSPWANSRFLVNLFNDPPAIFNLNLPSPETEVTEPQPELSWNNSSDADGDAISYSIFVYNDAALTDVVTSAANLEGGAEGLSSWRVPVPLVNHARYYWRVIAKDALGAETATAARAFVVDTGNEAPTTPVVVSPVDLGEVTATSVDLVVQNSTDTDGDPVTYVFEIDTLNTFDSEHKRSSGELAAGSSTTSWTVDGLVENQRYWWRAKANDGRTESQWLVASFLMSATNDAPPAPTIRNPGDGAWSSSQAPTLEANPVQDPEGQSLTYEFEVYRGVGTGDLVASGSSADGNWVVNQLLANATTHSWRVRAVDVAGAASDWSSGAVLYISTGEYQDLSMQVVSPNEPVTPVVNGGIKTVDIRWEGTNNNIEPTIALYYSTERDTYPGTLIVDGIQQASGTVSGQYTWNVTSLQPGTYYVYGVIYDSRSAVRAYANGAVVIGGATPTGTLVLGKLKKMTTNERGRSASFDVRLGSRPAADVAVPTSASNAREASVEPGRLNFTQTNWNVDQTVVITGMNDCAPEGVHVYQVLTGPTVSTDPNYIGISAPPVNVTSKADKDRADTTNNPNLFICGYVVLSEQQLGSKSFEYVLRTSLTNIGSAYGSVRATISDAKNKVQVVDGVVDFGAVGAGEHIQAVDTFTVRTSKKLSKQEFQYGLGLVWSVVAQ